MSLSEIRTKVDELYNNFEADIEKSWKDKNETKEVKLQVDSILELCNLMQAKLTTEERGEFYYLKGKTLNASCEYEAKAEQELSRSTKFNYAKAWNLMGELQFRQENYPNAQLCFQKAINLEKNPLYFRNISMLFRKLQWKTIQERNDNIAKGHDYIKEALKIDMNDGQSWMMLGNSFLASYFTVEAKPETLKSCKYAYVKAEEDPIAAKFAELHYSKFQIEWFEEEYNKALNSLKRAQELEPNWDLMSEKYEEGKKFLTQLSDLYHSRGRLGQRKINSLIADIKDNQLGPYENGSTPLTNGKKPELVPLGLLGEGLNADNIVLGKVVCTVVTESCLPFAFCIVDRDGTCRAVTVYNWTSKYGVKIGDSVAVLAPILKRHTFADENIKEFFSIRVAVPLMLVVNRKVVSKSEMSSSEVVSQKKG